MSVLDKINARKKSGGITWGEKTQNFLEEKSRESVEQHSNTQLIYFEVDYARSEKTLYGEERQKVFKGSGINIPGVISIVSDTGYDNNIINKTGTLEFGTYISTLRELNINPQFGDMFYVKNKWYQIYDKTTLDDNETMVAFDKAITIKFKAVELPDEIIPGNLSLNTTYMGGAINIKNFE